MHIYFLREAEAPDACLVAPYNHDTGCTWKNCRTGGHRLPRLRRLPTLTSLRSLIYGYVLLRFLTRLDVPNDCTTGSRIALTSATMCACIIIWSLGVRPLLQVGI